MIQDYLKFLNDDQIAIYLFHGVITRQRYSIRNYTRKHLPQDEFVLMMRDLRNCGSAVSMPEIVEMTEKKKTPPPRAFAITFDDGFRNNYEIAAPILSELGIPATFYVTTGFVDQNKASWTDMIEYAIENKDSFKFQSSFPDFNGTYATRKEKQTLLNRMRQVVKGHSEMDPYELAHEFWAQAGIQSMERDPELDEKMNWNEVRELNQNPLFSIGGHGHTHRILEHLEPNELEREIKTSLDLLRENLGEDIRHYSYPEGLAHCYSDRVIKVLKEKGILCALTAEPGRNRIGDDLFCLKRVMVI